MRFVFDVESNGLHGKAFAVGWVITQADQVISEGYLRCPIDDPINPWVEENVLPNLPPENCISTEDLRTQFWDVWISAKVQGATAWADCAFPVETNFLAACVADAPDERMWQAPFPLHEIGTVFELAGMDATAKHDRLPGEIAHHPTGDARQSARLLQNYFPE